MSYEELVQKNRQLQEEIDSANAIIDELREQNNNYEDNNRALSHMKHLFVDRINQLKKENYNLKEQVKAMQAEFEEVMNDILMPTEDQ